MIKEKPGIGLLGVFFRLAGGFDAGTFWIFLYRPALSADALSAKSVLGKAQTAGLFLRRVK